ncbi:adenine specific DNA methyltransferase [Desulfosporosinus sp. I2]|uniref:type ISP restriction/modification enzyme n=1 Tax=Desulfosporosinus sp. I2 TaxID=1617025 RepID=UPI0005F01409|nr:type ISP restriction/modification enzyme [Desulfosporosinus sp. I2]KJR45063.1 adenine specific DNA methyltransferase [Desulfosporosinus sp. I2]
MVSKLRDVNDFETLVEYFITELNWPLDITNIEDLDDLTFEYEPDELGLSDVFAAKIQSIKQLRPLNDNQPWGIFYIEFERKHIPVLALRKILSQLIPSKRVNIIDHAVWEKQDLLFLCFFGDVDNRAVGFAHFSEGKGRLPTLKTFYYEPKNEINYNFEEDIRKLKWPDNANDIENWRTKWEGAFTRKHKQVVTDSKTLSSELANLAVKTRNLIMQVFEIETNRGYLHGLYEKFKVMLIHDLTIEQFADMYAQTVAYGLFSARCMDTDDHFNPEEAIEHIPNTNPFLKKLMKECLAQKNSKLSFDELELNEIVELLKNTDTNRILDDFNRQTGGGKEDPVIYFYEGFLNAYESEQKKRRGVYYTPQPVVNFIVRAVDDILKTEFGYANGLASTETKTISIRRESKRKIDGMIKIVDDTDEVPAIQILDPATGTGTFLRQTILQIWDNFKVQNMGKSEEEVKRHWNEYVPKHLLPRLNGFELMMAPYAVAHMKLAMVLKETGYDFIGDERVNVFLTNSLEEAGNASMQAALWEDPLATESIEANQAKCNIGINVVIGNPPYNVSSSNRNEWIQDLITIYKEGLNERKINLDDDYIKFIRFGQSVVDKTCNGILAYITNNSFIGGVTHRKMRKTLMESFTKIYLINLHGDSNRRESCPDGSKDENVFDIQQGVSISLFVKNKKSLTNCEVYYTDVFGVREIKSSLLGNSRLKDICWQKIQPNDPYYFFGNKDYSQSNKYEEGFSVNDLFINKNTGIQTKNDKLTIGFKKSDTQLVVNDFKCLQKFEIEKKYGSKSGTWSIESAQSDLSTNEYTIVPILFRPFDIRYTALTTRSGGFLGRPRYTTMCHMIHSNNVALLVGRQNKSETIDSFLVTNCVSEMKCAERTIQSYHLPLFVVSKTYQGSKLIPNLSEPIVKNISNSLGLSLSQNVIIDSEYSFSSLDLLDYIYAVLYSNRYRERYRELLKIDFPRVPYPTDQEMFWKLVELGRYLRQLHLMESPALDNLITSYPAGGSNVVENPIYKDGAIFINKDGQGFFGVPQVAWEFYIGGYQPAQKWLKDRKGMAVTKDDILHYQKIIVALTETDRIMKEIDGVIEF